MTLALSHYPRFRTAALAEAAEILGPLDVLARPDPNVTVVSHTAGGDAVDWTRSVFVQHAAPAGRTTPLTGERSDLDRLVAEWEGAATELPAPFSVQCRRGARSGGGGWASATYSARDVEVAVGSALQDEGAVADPDHPTDVISICLGEGQAWSGLSAASTNIRRLGPLHRRYTTPWVICRAERKLSEAIDLWGLGPSLSGARAIDLGASPGGWTLVLAEAGAWVTAIDPGLLSDVVEDHPSVDHLRQRADSADIEESSIDWLVNDMNIDPPDVLAALEMSHRWLRPGGRAVCTLKLASKSSAREMLADFVSRLAPGFALESARHLYSNRQEVTLLLRRLPT